MIAQIVLICAAGIGIAVCLALLPDTAGPRGRRPAPPAATRPEQLVALERLTVISRSSALHVHAYLRPLLAEIASRRLAARGQRLDSARELLSEPLWEIVRPERPFPEDRYAPGIPPGELAMILEELEQL
jgi:hypothetical protein